eukprot:CAMPEP_0172315442 /NCGR_PEP_ID=MMETSP1058-20130122/25203_1 /TAXON_ID=83371 /ORGANISM="Detonula confervacea, Strain CCMP 353" /LENGTH=197 /DNA_ID=CAMNT_0013029519 /DNA_START=93 /DNA_END=686 /DNA_ORIENTATION=-
MPLFDPIQPSSSMDMVPRRQSTSTPSSAHPMIHHLAHSKEVSSQSSAVSEIKLIPDSDKSADISNRTRVKMNIDKITEFKRIKGVVANQQATIDTLSSKLHNIELANRQLRNMDQDRVKNFELENKILVGQLNECREREIGLRRELNSERVSSCPGRDQHSCDDGLMRENSNLQRELALLKNSIIDQRTNRTDSICT